MDPCAYDEIKTGWPAAYLATRPAQVIRRGPFTESALAWIATSKYLDGLPLHRQAALLGRLGGPDISRNTVAGSIVRLGQLVSAGGE